MKSARILYGLAAVWWVLALSQAVAQRVQFATPVAADPTAPASVAPPLGPAPPSAYGPSAAPSPYPAPPPSAPPAATYPPPAPVWGPAPAAPGAPAPAAPGAPGAMGAPGSLPPTYTVPPGAAAPPGAVPGGGIQPPPPNWDPYATPGGAPSPLLPQDPYLQGGCGQFSMATMQKFIQHVDLNFDWFAGNGDHELGIDDVNLSVTFSFPMLYNSATPLLVTPGFAVHYWSGPVSVLPPAMDPTPAPADMPPRTYDAYLDFAWNPWVNEFFGAELNFRTGVYSDFYLVTNQSLRYMGKGEAVLRFSPSVTVKAGIWYLDRVTTKILPAGGICWTPNPDVYFDILFPNPKIGKRLTTWGNTEWWLYARGDYGGGVWTVQRNTDIYNNSVAANGVFYPKMSADLVDYDDIRIALGLEFKTLHQLKGNFEVGFACDRQLNYKSGLPPAFYPNSTVFVGAGLSY